MLNKTTKWRHQKLGKPLDEARDYARLSSFNFKEVFPQKTWRGTPIFRIRRKTEFVNFAKRCAKGEAPYTVAAEMRLPEGTTYMWIEKLLLLIKENDETEKQRLAR